MREDRLHESRIARIVAPALLLANVVILAYLVIDGAEARKLVGQSLLFVPQVFLFVRTRRPMHTWPAWLFIVKR